MSKKRPPLEQLPDGRFLYPRKPKRDVYLRRVWGTSLKIDGRAWPTLGWPNDVTWRFVGVDWDRDLVWFAKFPWNYIHRFRESVWNFLLTAKAKLNLINPWWRRKARS